MDRRNFMRGAAAAVLLTPSPAQAKIRRAGKFPWPGAALDFDFIRQRYFWGGREHPTSDFTSFTLNGSTFDATGLTPSSTIAVSLALATAGITTPGCLLCLVFPTNNAVGGASRVPVVLDDGGATNVIQYLQSSANGNISIQVIASSVTQASIPALVTSNLNGFLGLAASIDTNSFRYSQRGLDAAEDVAGSIPVVTTLRIGKNTVANTQFAGAVARVVWLNGARSQNDLAIASRRLPARTL